MVIYGPEMLRVSVKPERAAGRTVMSAVTTKKNDGSQTVAAQQAAQHLLQLQSSYALIVRAGKGNE